MPKKVNITIGRFQPFTQGHLNMILEGELPCIIYRINSSDRDPSKIKGKKISKQELERVSEFAKTGKGDLTEREKEILKRPFSNELIEKELDIVKRNYKKDIIDIIYVKNAYEAVEDFNNKVKEGEYEPQYLMCGDDRVEKYKTLIKSFPDLEGKLEPNIGSGRSSGVSGSLVRKSILEKNQSAFEKMMPKGTGGMFGDFCDAFGRFLRDLDGGIKESRSLKGYLSMILEGGAAGHMAHPYDYTELTGKELCNLVGTLFSGKLEHVKEKLDGTNIYATMNEDGEVVFIRNKSDLNSERGGMTIEDMANKWAMNPRVRDVFVKAGEIIRGVFSQLGTRYFNPRPDTRKVINCECITSGKTNVMIYASDMVAFHGYVIYKKGENGWEEYKKVEGHVEDIYNVVNAGAYANRIAPRPDIIIKTMEDTESYKKKYIDGIKKLYKDLDLDLNATLEEWKKKKFEEVKPQWMTEMVDVIFNRWLNDDKTVRVTELKKVYPDHYEELKGPGKEYVQKVMEPLDELFMGIGIDFMKICDGFINANCERYVTDVLRKDMLYAWTAIMDSDDPDAINKTLAQIKRIGDKNLSAAEGVVFTYKGKVMKLTGTFAALNQLHGVYRNKFGF